MPSSTSFLLLVLCVLVLVPSVSAFGAGEIPDFAYLNDKAFRHLDIENILVNIVRWNGSSGGGLMGILGSVTGGGEKKFTKADVQRVYFGNWLRDYSQAMDIAGLSKATSETIILLLSVLSFMTFGYGTAEFALEAEKLGVYLPVEHIDNPKGYGGDDDPRKYHPKLRGPVNPRELEVDSRTGMKNYIANDGQGWDTSAAHVRRSLEKAIQLARQSGGHRSPELYEAYRLMGGALHTLEDLLAHSNWIELSLNKMGCRDIFTHVGDSVTVNAPGGQRVSPLVTGTFGSADFIFSVMGEAGDKLSESSVSELSKKVSDAKGQQGTLESVKGILDQVPSGGEETQAEMKQADELQAKAYNFDPDNYTTEEVQKTLWDILVWRDTIFRKISTIIEKIPGMETVLDQLTEALNVYIYTTIEPYVKPVLATASEAIGTGSRMVIDQDDQYEVFNNSNASDPSHSMISKDHFDNILNEPAGKIAKVVVEVAVHKIVAAWSDQSVDVRRTIDEILQALHHPYFADERSEIQMAMAQTVKKWYDGLGNDRQETLSRLSKESVRNGENKRLGADKNAVMHSHAIGSSSHRAGHGPSYGAPYSGGGHQQQSQSGYGGNQRQQQAYGHTSSAAEVDPRRMGRTGGHQEEQHTSSYGQQSSGGYGHQQSREEDPRRVGRTQHEEPSYGRGEHGGREQDSYGQSGGRGQESYGRETSGYGSGRREEESSYGQSGYGGSGGNRSGGREQESYGQSGGYQSQSQTQTSSYGRQESHQEDPRRVGRTKPRDDDESNTSSYNQGGYGGGRNQGSYGRDEEESGYGQRGHGGSGGGRHRQEEEEEGGRGYGGRSHGRDDDDTYGVERLNIGGESRGYGDRSGGYGGGRSYEQETTSKHKKHKDDSEEEEEEEDDDEEKKQRKYHKKQKSDDDSEDNDDDDEDDHKKKKKSKHHKNQRDDDY